MIAGIIMARNSASTIAHAVASLSWCDSLFLLDDHSEDDTAKLASAEASVPLIIERSPYARTAFIEGELIVRNYSLERAEALLAPDAIVLLDADEVMDGTIEQFARQVERGTYSSLTCSIFHLFDAARYIRYRESVKNGLYQIDPHVRVVSPGMRYVELRKGQQGHPLMVSGVAPLHLHGAFHFHLKYLQALKLQNSSLEYLSSDISESEVAQFLREITFALPGAVIRAFTKMGHKYESGRQTEFLPVTSVNNTNEDVSSCLLVTAKAPSETIVLRRVLDRLLSSSWINHITVVSSEPLQQASERVRYVSIREFLAEHHPQFGLILQLSPDMTVAEIVRRLPAIVYRGLISSTAGLFCANILALGYLRALDGHGGYDIAALAAQACEVE